MADETIFDEFHNKMRETFPDLFAEANDYEAVGIALCLIPIVQPDILDNFIKQDLGTEGEFPLVGGIRGVQHRGILPTAETWLYFCCGTDIDKRLNFIRSIPQYLQLPKALLNVEPAIAGEPFLSGKLVFSTYARKRFRNLSLIYEQRLSNMMLGGFIDTELTLNDLVLSDQVLNAIQEIKHWQHFNETTNGDHAFTKRIKKGLKMIFHGKSGTGKSQTAAIIGRELGKPVYRIDLSQVISKYVGETEKNYAKLFEYGEQNSLLIFFDEGDAIFSKRTSVNSSNDHYANQEVAYLLQRIEDYTGIIIISTNLRENIDAAFVRRFQIITEFALPDKSQRKLIWEKLFSELDQKTIVSKIEWEEISKTELSGGGITNVVNYARLKANYLKEEIRFPLIREGIIRELRKENRLSML